MQRNRRRTAARPTFVKFLRARLAAALPTRSRSEPSALKPGCCAVAKQSKPRWGFEAHERARFAGWRRSLCAAKRALSEVAGTFSVPFGSPKGTHKSSMLLKRVKRRKVARNGSRALAKSGPPRRGKLKNYLSFHPNKNLKHRPSCFRQSASQCFPFICK